MQGGGGVQRHDDVDGRPGKVNALIYPKYGLAEGGGNDSLSVCSGPCIQGLLDRFEFPTRYMAFWSGLQFSDDVCW
jgi:hypothetical protein